MHSAYRQRERIAFGFLVSQKFAGEHTRLSVLRGGKELEVDVELVQPRSLVPLHLEGNNPSFFVVAGKSLLPYQMAVLKGSFQTAADCPY